MRPMGILPASGREKRKSPLPPRAELVADPQQVEHPLKRPRRRRLQAGPEVAAEVVDVAVAAVEEAAVDLGAAAVVLDSAVVALKRFP